MKFRLAEHLDLCNELKKELLENGFLSGDIYEVSSRAILPTKSYGAKGVKEIPNTVKIHFDSSGVDPYLFQANMLISRLKHGGKLVDFEGSQLAGYSCCFELECDPDISSLINEEGNRVNYSVDEQML